MTRSRDSEPTSPEVVGNFNPSGIQGVCPNGWHVPSNAEWVQLTDYVSSQSTYICGDNVLNIGKALASTSQWESASGDCEVGNNPSENNSTGFSALPAGEAYFIHTDDYSTRYYNYTDLRSEANFWSATLDGDDAAWSFEILGDWPATQRETRSRNIGYSVRCVKD